MMNSRRERRKAKRELEKKARRFFLKRDMDEQNIGEFFKKVGVEEKPKQVADNKA